MRNFLVRCGIFTIATTAVNLKKRRWRAYLPDSYRRILIKPPGELIPRLLFSPHIGELKQGRRERQGRRQKTMI